MAQPDEYGYFFLYFDESTARQGFMEFCLQQFSKRMVPLVETRRVLSLLY